MGTLALSEELAGWSVSLSFNDLSSEAVHATKRAYLDWLASALAGSRTPPAQTARRAIERSGGAPQATVFPDGWRTSAPQAAFLNALSSHILELDDLHRPSTLHPAAPIIPAAVAVAEREGASGRDLLTAIAAGYEVAIRIGEAVNPAHYRYWHPTGTVATFGAAVAAAKLQGLSAEQTATALGSAGTQAAGLWEFNTDGAMSKHLHPGHAALAGVFAADLAREGFTGARRILEGRRGFFEAMAGEYDSHVVTDNLGSVARFRIEEVTFKRYPCCGHTHTGIDLAVAWAPKVRDDPVEALEVHTYKVALDIVGNPDPKTPYQAKFSYPYVLAWALTHGFLDERAFSEQALNDPSVRALLPRIRLYHEPTFDGAYPGAYPVRLVLHTRSGRVLEERVDHPRGSPENPIGDEELVAKVTRMVGQELAERLANHAFGLAQRERVNLLEVLGG